MTIPPLTLTFWGMGGRAKILLKCDGQGNALETVFGYTLKQAMDALKIVTKENETLLRAWRKIHG